MLESLRNFAKKALNAIPLSSPIALEIFGAPATTTNLPIDAMAALRVPAIAQGVKLISEAVATLDAHLCREGKDGRERVTPADHPVAKLLDRPNPWTGESEWKRQLVADYLIWGNGIAPVARVRGEPRELHRADPRAVNIVIDMVTGEPRYGIAMQSGGTREYAFADVVHIRNQSIDGVRGLGLVNIGAEAIGLSLTLERHAAGMFSRGARPGGILEIAGKLNDATIKRLRESFSNIYSGADNAGRTAILEQGQKFQPLQLASTDSQFLENRRFQVLEAARLLNIPPVLLGDLEHATLNNAAELSQQFLDRTITPILELFEDALELVLLTEKERDADYAIEFDTTNFVRADVEKRFGAYKSGIESGVLLLNEAREREGLGPVDGGDQPMRSVQTIPLAPNAAPPTPAAQPQEAPQ
ncbi:MAG: phage portal protein [Methylocystis sp.]